MLPSRPFFACFAAVVAVVSAASCGGTDAATGPLPAVDGGLPDVVETDSAPPPPPCNAPKTTCGSACVDTSADTKNCGGCGTACQGPELCIASKCKYVPGFAARKVYLGDTDRAGVSGSTAWRTYGRDIDGIATIAGTDGGECMRAAGAPASTQTDGENGIDNSWGRNIIPFLLGLQPTPTKSTNDLLEAGARTLMLQFDTPPTQTGVAPFALVTAENTIAPKWDGNDSRPVAESSTTGGKPKNVFPAGAFAAGVLTSGDGSAAITLSFGFGAGAFDVPIRLTRISMTLAADGKTTTEGTVSGVVDTEELVTSFERVAGSISTSLCSGSTLDTIKATIRQASDILVDGKQDPTKSCNAISIGIGFDAVSVAVGPIAGPVAAPKDPCKP
jgi:hypothetical protein